MAETITAVLVTFLFPVLIYGTLSVVGVLIERNHLARLDAREAEIGHFPIFDIANPPPGVEVMHGHLVSGGVVMGTGYLKQLLATLRSIVGGEVRGFQKVLDRGRREAQLRMIDEARAIGATAIINARYETVDVGGRAPAAEVFCYGTAVK
jgi:uncharacterized protein YbjQ (UPF0145 family)